MYSPYFFLPETLDDDPLFDVKSGVPVPYLLRKASHPPLPLLPFKEDDEMAWAFRAASDDDALMTPSFSGASTVSDGPSRARPRFRTVPG